MLLHVDSCAWAMFGPKLSELYWQHHAVTWPKVFAGPGVHIYRKLQKHTWKAEFVQWACQEILPTIRIQKADLENEQVKASIWHEYDQARTCQLRLTSFNDISMFRFKQSLQPFWIDVHLLSTVCSLSLIKTYQNQCNAHNLIRRWQWWSGYGDLIGEQDCQSCLPISIKPSICCVLSFLDRGGRGATFVQLRPLRQSSVWSTSQQGSAILWV